MERGSPFHLEKFYSEHSSPHYSGEHFSEDMTQDSGPSEEDNKEHIQLLDLDCGNTNSLQLNNFDDAIKSEREPDNFHQDDDKQVEAKSDKNSEPARPEDGSVRCNSDFTISNSVNSMKSIRMNIRRKRFCSNSSTVSNNDSVSEEKRACRRMKKRRKRKLLVRFVGAETSDATASGFVKDENVLTSSKQYVTHSGEIAFGLINEQKLAMEMAAAAADSANLEVSAAPVAARN